MTQTLREQVARMVCEQTRIIQGFISKPEYTLSDEVHNVWDLFLPNADAIIALLIPPGYVVGVNDMVAAARAVLEEARDIDIYPGGPLDRLRNALPDSGEA